MRKARKMVTSILFLFILLFDLSACSKSRDGTQLVTPLQNDYPVDNTNVATADIKTAEGYICTEIDNPEWLSAWGGCEIVGDSFYLLAYTTDGNLEIATFDTVKELWNRYGLEIGPSIYPGVERFSATENSIWVLFRENITEEEAANQNFSRELGYYLLHFNLSSGEQTWNTVPFWTEGNPYLLSLIALDSNRAFIGDGEKTYFIDEKANVIDMPELNIQGEGLHVRVNGRLYIQTENGLSELDLSTLHFCDPIEEIYDQSVYCSNLGHFLTTKDNILYNVDPSSGTETKLFSWTDVALSYSRLFGWNGLENSNGDIFHLTDRISKISKGEIPVKETLTLACLGDTSDEMYEFSNHSYVCTSSLMDAIIRFNNSDPEFRIQIVPLIYNNDAERDKLLIELGTGNNIDILDTSLLPAGAVDKQIFIDMLPYIDEDENISRDDFIPSLLKSMTRSGGLYEYVDKFTVLTMITHPDFVHNGKWNVEDIESLLKQHPDMLLPTNQEQLVMLFAWAATAEFVDISNGTCNFDNSDFEQWLSLLKSLCSRTNTSDSNAFLFNIIYDFARHAGFSSRRAMMDEYIPVGFPNSAGTGSYFMRLGTARAVSSTGYLSGNMFTSGSSTSLGIMASSKNPDGAWRFIRTFMLGENEPSLIKGVPVLKESFERAIEHELSRDRSQEALPFEPFNQSDAAAFRQLVYNTDKVVLTDDVVVDVLTATINSYLGGKSTEEETAQQIQSRISIYLAEQFG